MRSIQEIVRQEIPIEFFIEWNDSLQNAYNLAVSHVANGGFEYPQAKNVLPYEYNAYADQILKQISRKYSCFDITDAQTEQGYHFTILRTESIIITQKSISSPGSMVEISNFRHALARGNSIYTNEPISYLFPFDSMKKDASKDKIYGILTHNRASVFSKGEVAFSNLAFPDPSFCYYIENINLTDYCNVVNIVKPVEHSVAEILDEVKPVLKIGIVAEEAK